MASLSSVLKLTLLDGVTGPARRIQGVLAGFQSQQIAAMASFNSVAATVATAAATYFAVHQGLDMTAGAAMRFESAFADVKKVVDATPEQFEFLSKTIRKMSTELPIAATDIAELFAAAGESNIPVEELQSFAEMAARVGVAFDMSAGEAGESLAKLKDQLGLTVAETGAMADAINHLSNNMASKAKDITAYMLRVGKFAEMSGFAKEQVAAIGSAMISAGAEAETAGTAMMNVVRKMTSGEFAKKDQRSAAKALGLDLPTLAKQMQKDAPGALKKVLKAIAKAPKEKQIALLSQFFGDEARAFAPLVGNVGLLDKALDSVNDKAKYGGSAFREYVARADTLGNVLEILNNRFVEIGISLGDRMLPGIKEGAKGINDVLDTLGERAHIFDDINVAVEGFAQGFGYDKGIRELVNDVGDLLLGVADGGKSADELGRIFAKFKEYGASVREFSAAVRESPIAQFLGEIGGQGFKLMLAAVGISLVAGAFMKLARAIAFLTGITTAIGLLKTIGKIGGVLGGAAAGAGAGAAGAGAGAAGAGAAGAGAAGAAAGATAAIGAAGVLAYAWLMSKGGKILKDDTARQERDNQKSAQNIQALKSLLGLGGNDNSSHPYRDGNYDDGGRAASMDTYLGTPETKPTVTSGSPVTVDQLLTGLQGKPMSLDAGTIGQLLQPSRGVQEVRVTNKEPPNVTVSNVFNITGVSSPEAAADAAASRLGQAVKSAVESSYSD